MENVLALLNRNWIPVRHFDEFFDDVFAPSSWGRADTQTIYTPQIEVEETDGHFLVSMDVPGVPKDNIQIEVRDGSLRVVAERKPSSKTAERYYGKWERTFTLPKGIEAAHVEAGCEDGVLRIAIPKAEAAKPRLIKVQEGKTGFFQKLLSNVKKEEGSKADIAVEARSA